MRRSGMLFTAGLIVVGLVTLFIIQVTRLEREIEVVEPVAAFNPEEPEVKEVVTGPAEMEWMEPETKPREAETRSPTREASNDLFKLTGTISVIDSAGVKHDEETGRFALVLWKGNSGHHQNVNVENGSWVTEVPKDIELGFDDANFGDRPAFFKDMDKVTFPSDGVLHLTVWWPGQTHLHVISADTGQHLTDVELAVVEDWMHSDDPHPGGYGKTVLNHATSPILLDEIEKKVGLHHQMDSRYYFARSPGYAWNRINVNFELGGDHFLKLVSGGSVEVNISGYDDKSSCILRVRKEDTNPKPDITDEMLEKIKQEFLAADIPEEMQREILEQVPSGEDPLSGWYSVPTAEVPIHRNGRINIESIPQGRYLVSAEAGDWYSDPLILARAEVEVTIGRTALTALFLSPPPEYALVPLRGSLSIPAAWGIDRFSLTLDFLDTPLTSAPDYKFLSSRNLESVTGAEETVYTWDFGSVQTGRYKFKVDPPFYLMSMTVEPGGLTDAVITVPPPASVTIRVVDAETLQDVVVDGVYWHPVWPPGSSGGSLESVDLDKTTGLFEFHAPLGTIEVSIDDENYTMLSYMDMILEVKPGQNHHTIEVNRSCGIIVIVKNGDKLLPWNSDWDVNPVAADEESSSRGMCWGPHPEGRRITVTAPGWYAFEFQQIDGYRPVDKQEVDVKAGEFTRHVIVLERDR